MNIKIGDSILTRFGESKIVGITLTAGPNADSGDAVPVVGIESVFAGKTIFDMENGHWVYGQRVFAFNNVSVQRLREVA
jgi:hypothetical protein